MPNVAVAAHLVRKVEAGHRLADQMELTLTLQRRLGRGLERRSGRGQLAIARDLSLRAMHDPAT